MRDGRPTPVDGERSQILLWGLIIAGVFAALIAGGSVLGGGTLEKGDTAIVVAPSPTGFHDRLQEGTGGEPGPVRVAESPPAAVHALATGDAGIGVIPLTTVPTLLRELERRGNRPSIDILPYTIPLPNDIAGFYVRENSTITGIQDLEGRTIVFPFRYHSLTMMAFSVLRDTHDITFNRSWGAPLDPARAPTFVSVGEADAAFVIGDPPAGFRSVWAPLSSFSEGGEPAVTSVVVAREDVPRKERIAAVQRLNASISPGIQGSGRSGLAAFSRASLPRMRTVLAHAYGSGVAFGMVNLTSRVDWGLRPD